MLPASATALLTGVVDYAGLFPPAALSMAAAVAEFQAALGGPDRWLLGRFVVPAARLPELSAAITTALTAPDSAPRDVWPVSAIVRDRSDADLAAITAFNADGAHHFARVDALECKPGGLDGIDWLGSHAGDGIDVYVEIAAGPDVDRWLERVGTVGLRAKVRTGGVTAEAFPSPALLAAFLDAAVRHGVVFKATAGLHHAVRGHYRLTYDDGAAAAPMYGYLNVLLATAALRMGRPVDVAEALLQANETTALVFTDDDVRWGDEILPLSQLRDTRVHHLVSFGSCSFREPADEIGALLSR